MLTAILHLQHSCWKLHLIRNDQLTVTICLPVRLIFSKEVIRPQVPLRPPCYDFSLLVYLRFDTTKIGRASPKANSDGATGGVCKEQGRIHRAMMTRGY